MIRRPPSVTRTDTLFPYTTLFRSSRCGEPVSAHEDNFVGSRNRPCRCDAGAFLKLANYIFVADPRRELSMVDDRNSGAFARRSAACLLRHSKIGRAHV